MLLIEKYEGLKKQLEDEIQQIEKEIDSNNTQMGPDCTDELYSFLVMKETHLYRVRRLKMRELESVKDKISVSKMLHSRNGDPEEWILELARDEGVLVTNGGKHLSLLHMEV